MFFLFFFGLFGGGCIGIVYLESLFWHLFIYEILFTYQKKKKQYNLLLKKKIKKNTQMEWVQAHVYFGSLKQRGGLGILIVEFTKYQSFKRLGLFF